MSLDIPFEPMGELVRRHGRERPDAPAVTVDGKSLSWGALSARADRVAASLQRDGVKPGQSIAIISYTNTDYPVLYMGALMAGVAVAPMPPSATPAQLEAMVVDSGAPILFLDRANAEALSGVKFSARIQMIEDLDSWLADGPAQPLDIPLDKLEGMPFNII